jgi:hypothetical protein
MITFEIMHDLKRLLNLDNENMTFQAIYFYSLLIVRQFIFSRQCPSNIDVMITSGIATSNLIALNFTPTKDASNIVIGTQQTAEAPI